MSIKHLIAFTSRGACLIQSKGSYGDTGPAIAPLQQRSRPLSLRQEQLVFISTADRRGPWQKYEWQKCW